MSSDTPVAQKRGRGRPRSNPAVSSEETTRKPIRVPITGHRDPLQLEGTDPDFFYRWVKDTAETGSNILRHTQAGYSFVTDEEGLIIGESTVYKSDNVGTCIRVPAGSGEYLYLMKLPMEWRIEDDKAKAREVDATEEGLRETLEQYKSDGGYGNVEINRK